MASSKAPQRDGSGNNQERESKPKSTPRRRSGLDFNTTALGYRLALERPELKFNKLHSSFAPQEESPATDTTGMCEMGALLLQKMNQTHIALIGSALDREISSESPLTESDLRAFLMMHSGVRELKMRNFVSAAWAENEWRNEVQNRRDAYIGLCSMCDLEEPGAGKKKEALELMLPELSGHQKDILTKTHKPDPGEPTNNDLRRLKDFFEISPEKARDFWRRNNMDLLTLGDIIHKVRFSNDPRFTQTEIDMLANMCSKIGRPAIDPADPSQFIELKAVFDDICPEDGPAHIYQPLVVGAWLMNKDIDLSSFSLLDSARREEEFHTLCVFLGAGQWKSAGRLDASTIVSEPANYRALNGKTNEDNASSATITYPDESTGRIDSVFDGVGGYAYGSVASGLAKDIFEIYALAGWFEGPEDLRRLLSTIDISIVMAQISSGDNYNMGAKYDPNRKYLRTSQMSMGTTATVSLQKGRLIWVAHAGDSDCKIANLENEEPQMIFGTLTHSKIAGLTLIAETENTLREMKEALPLGPASFDSLPMHQMLGMISTAEKAAEERVKSNSMGYGVTNYVSSFLGGSAHFMHINNSTRNYLPIFIQNPGKTMLAMASDGLWDNICEKDCASIMKSSSLDSTLARTKLMEIARAHSIEYKHIGSFPAAAELVKHLDDGNVAIPPMDRSLILSLKPEAETQFTEKAGKDSRVFIVEIDDNGKATLRQKLFYLLSNFEMRAGKDDDRTVNCRRMDEGFGTKG